MQRSKAMPALIIVVVVLAIALVVLSIVLFGQKKQNNEHLETIAMQEQTIEALQDEGILELVEHIKSIMKAEVFITDKNNPLWYYSYREQTYPEMVTTEVDLKVVSAKVEGNTGELVISYGISYLDDKGETVRFTSASEDRPTTLWLEKQNEKWVVVDKHSYL